MPSQAAAVPTPGDDPGQPDPEPPPGSAPAVEGLDNANDLLMRLIADDGSAWTEALKIYGPSIMRTARRLTQGIPGISEGDICQETFIQAWKYIQQVNDPESLGAWLRMIATRRCYAHIARFKSSPFALVDPDSPDKPTEGRVEAMQAILTDDDASKLSQLGKGIKQLKPQEQIAIDCKYFSEVTDAVAAASLGVVTSTYKLWLKSAKAKLRRFLRDE